ncbi:hypothetical protein BH11GEM1_BH11GEM1_09430 [soil metagenome]
MTARKAAVVLLGTLALAACSSNTAPAGLSATGVAVSSVTPAGGTTGVDPAAPVTIAFSRPMMAGMDLLVLLHEGSVTGPQVVSAATWSADRMQLTLVPSQTLKSKTNYVLHLSPNLQGSDGMMVDFAGHAQAVGGEAVPSTMMTGGMMGGGTGQGMMSGPGWQAGSGMWGFGMSLTFTTR